MFNQEDYDDMCNSEARHVINYIAKHAGDYNHEDGITLKLEDFSADAYSHMMKRNPDADKHNCSAEVMVSAEDMGEVQKIMLRLLKKQCERGM